MKNVVYGVSRLKELTMIGRPDARPLSEWMLPVFPHSAGLSLFARGDYEEKEADKINYVQLFWCTDGAGMMRIAGSDERVAAGDVVITYPGEEFRNVPLSSPWRLRWVTFDGPGAVDFMKSFGYTRRIVGAGCCPEEYFRRVEIGLIEGSLPAMRRVLAALCEIIAAAGNAGMSRGDERLIERFIVAVKENFDNPSVNLNSICEMLGVHRSTLTRTLSPRMGVSPGKFLLDFRIHQGLTLLRDTGLTVAEIAGRVGFGDPAYFCRVIRSVTGMSPGRFRRRGGTGPELPPSPENSAAVFPSRRSGASGGDAKQNIRKLCVLFESLSAQTGCRFVWHTFINDEVSSIPGIRLYHDSDYCVAVKNCTTKLRQCCADEHWRISCRRSQDRCAPYVVTCHAGVTEIVVPIFRGGIYVGDIFIGPFGGGDGSPLHRFQDEYSRLPHFSPGLGEWLQRHVQLLLELFPPEFPEYAPASLCPPPPADCEERIYKLLVYLRQYHFRKITLSEAARLTGLSIPRLQHLFRETMGVSFSEYLQRLRIGTAYGLVESTTLSMNLIAEQCGISDQARLAVLFRRYFGETPSGCREKLRKRQIMERN